MPKSKLGGGALFAIGTPLWICLLLGVIAFGTRQPIRPLLVGVCAAFALLAIAFGGPWMTYDEAKVKGAWTFIRVSATAGVTAILLLVAGVYAGQVGNGTTAPVGITDPLNPDQAGALLRYAESLEYASEHHAMDEDWLEVKPPRADTVDSIIGPRARVFPERRSHRNSRADLGPGAGRIVARFEVEADRFRGGRGYDKLGLPVGVSYLWIDNVRPEGDTVPARAIIVSSTGAREVPNGVFLSLGKDYASHAQARWQFDPADPCVCESCVWHHWCRVCGN